MATVPDIYAEQTARLRKVYEDSGLSQRELCELIGTSTSNLTYLLRGDRKLTIRFAEKIEAAMGIGVDWLLFGGEETKDYPCGDEMILFLKQHPEIRKTVWEQMRKKEKVDE